MAPNIRLRVLPQILPTDGRDVEIRNNGTYIQWRYATDHHGDYEWQNIIAISALVGPAGPAIELRTDGTNIQYRVVGAGDDDWVDVIPLADLKGAQGDAATIEAGTVTVLSAGSPGTVVNSGTPQAAVFDFGIPALQVVADPDFTPGNSVTSFAALGRSGAVGDGTANDGAAYATAEAAVSSLYLPDGKTFNLNATFPTVGKLVKGPGAVIANGVTIGGMDIGFDILQTNIVSAPDIYAEKKFGLNGTPGTGVNNFNNVIFAAGSNAKVSGVQVWRSELIGAQIGEQIVEWERMTVIGNQAMRWSRYANRNVAIGALAMAWAGDNNPSAHLHDFFLASSNPIQPGAEGAAVTITGVTNASPGVVTAAAHGFTNGQAIKIASVVGMTQLNGNVYKVAGVTTNTFTLLNASAVAVDTTAFTPYTSGGEAKLQWNFDDLEIMTPGTGALIAGFSAWAATRDEVAGNVSVGRDSGLHLIKGTQNTWLGYRAGTNSWLVDYNTVIGNRAHHNGVFASYMTAMGYEAAYNWMNGNRNTVIGEEAAFATISGDTSLVLGARAGWAATRIQGSILLGYRSGEGWGTSDLDNVFAVQNLDSRLPLVSGNFKVNGSAPLSFGVNILPANIRGTAHIRTGVSGVTTFSSTSDDLIVENSGSGGITLAAPNGARGILRFAHPANSDAAAIFYDQSDNIMRIGLNAVTRLAISSTGMGFNGTAASAKPVITGSRGGNAAIASLLTAGATIGLWTDSTTA